MSLADKIKHQEEAARKEGISAGGGGWVKLKEGDNRFRVLTEPEMIFEDFKMGICYTDCGYSGNAKFLMYVLDRADNKIKLWKAPYTVGTTIAGYEKDEEYQFDGYPMPFDVKLNAKGAGTKEVKYALVPGRATTAVGSEVMDELAKKTPVVDIVAKMKEKKKQEHIEDGTWDREQERKAKLKADLDEARGKGGQAESDYPKDDINPDDIPF
jgi:hypothetical protein